MLANNIASAAPIFTALGDRTRLYIVDILCKDGPQSISRLTDGTDITRQALTKHLRVLANAGLARSKRRGREQIWEVDSEQLSIAEQWISYHRELWGQRTQRLARFVDDRNPGQ